MVDISRLSRLVTGVQRQVDLQSNALVVGSLKVGSVTPTELTKAILDNLIALQNGSDFSNGTNSHTHDGCYFTETEISSTSNGQGASLVGIEDASSYYTGANLEVVLNEIEAQIGGLTSATYSFGEANVLANNDAVYAALNKLDLKWGDLASVAASEGASLVGIEDVGTLYTGTTVEAALQEVGVDAANLRTLSGTADGAVHLGTFTGTVIPDSSTTKGALQSLETYAEVTRGLVNGLEWQYSALDYIVNNTIAPPTEVSGNRYVLSHDGGAPHASWDGASAGNIVEFNGSVWVATVPTVGTFISVDDETTLLYYWGGSAWTAKAFESTSASGLLEKNVFDITFASSTIGNMIVYDASGEAASVAMSGEATISSVGAVTLNNAAVIGKVLTSIDVATNGSVTAADSILVAVGKIVANQVDLTSLSGVAQGAVNLGTFTGATISDSVTIKAALQELETALESIDASEVTYAPSTLSDWNSSADPGNVDDGLDQLASRVKTLEGGTSALTESIAAGETLTAGVKALRYGLTAASETAGRVYFADPTELSVSGLDPFYVVGLAVTTGEVAGVSVVVYKAGVMPATAHGFSIGQPIYLSSTGALTGTAPTAAAEAVVKVGIAKDANNIEVQVQVMGVN